MPLGDDRNENKATNTSNSKAASNHSGVTSELPPIMSSPPEPIQTPSGHKPTSKDTSKWRDNTKLGLEIGGLCVLIVYTIFSALQWAQIRWTNRLTRDALGESDKSLQATLGKMQAQTDATNNLLAEAKLQTLQEKRSANSAQTALTDSKAAIRLEERPWVNIVKVYVNDFPNGDETLTFWVTNSGKSPAFAVHGLALFEAYSMQDAETPTFVFTEGMAKGSINFTPNPPEPYSIPFKGALHASDVKLYKDGKIHVYLGLQLWYKDYWGTAHVDRFCEYFQPESQAWVARKPDHCED